MPVDAEKSEVPVKPTAKPRGQVLSEHLDAFVSIPQTLDEPLDVRI